MGSVKMEGDVPVCDMCGSLMTEFDGWAWHTCPEYGNSVRIIDGEVKWEREIFGRQAATYGGRTCEYCGQPLAGGEHTSASPVGINENSYLSLLSASAGSTRLR